MLPPYNRSMDTKARPEAMAPDELRDALGQAGFGQTEFARLIGRTASSIRMHIQGMRPISGELALLLRLLADDPELKEKALRLSGMRQEDLTPPRKRKKQAEPGSEDAPLSPGGLCCAEI